MSLFDGLKNRIQKVNNEAAAGVTSGKNANAAVADDSSHSEAYRAFFAYKNASGMEKAHGSYDPELFDKILPEERDEIEDVIWRTVTEGHEPDMAVFMPGLKKYDGITALDKLLSEKKHENYAFVLYEATGDEKYLDVIDEIINESGLKDPSSVPPLKRHSISGIVAKLKWIKPCLRTFEILAEVYIETEDRVLRSSVADGFLMHLGILRDPMNHQMVMRLAQSRTYDIDDREERIKKVDELRPMVMEKLKEDTHDLIITIPDGKEPVTCFAVRYASYAGKPEGEPSYGLMAVTGVSYTHGIHQKLLGWYKDEESVKKEFNEICDAIASESDSYELKYYTKINCGGDYGI